MRKAECGEKRRTEHGGMRTLGKLVAAVLAYDGTRTQWRPSAHGMCDKPARPGDKRRKLVGGISEVRRPWLGR